VPQIRPLADIVHFKGFFLLNNLMMITKQSSPVSRLKHSAVYAYTNDDNDDDDDDDDDGAWRGGCEQTLSTVN